MSEVRPLAFRKVASEAMAKQKGEPASLKVFARVRPFTASEIDAHVKNKTKGYAAKYAGDVPPMAFKLLANTIVAQPFAETALPPAWQPQQQPAAGGAGGKTFSFEMCFCSAQQNEQRGRQEDIYAHIGPPLTRCAFEGFNGALMAYGQTGSGKTYTMMGPPKCSIMCGEEPRSPDGIDERGVIPRFVDDIFAIIGQRQEQEKGAMESFVSGGAAAGDSMPPSTTTYRVTAKYFEIYCEKAYDLLTNDLRQVRVRDSGVIENIREVVVTNRSSVFALIRTGSQNRRTAATLKNAESSRSHAVFQLAVHQDIVPLRSRDEPAAHADPTELSGSRLTQAAGPKPKHVMSTINLVDLAGSERQKQSGAEGQQFKEMVNINLSLTTLHRVIQVLHDNSTLKNKQPAPVPLRESMLTHVLSSSFGGNSKSFVVVALSPSAEDISSTYSTLEFSSIARRVVNRVTVNVDDNTALLRGMADEIERLKTLLAEAAAAQRALPPSPPPTPPPVEVGERRDKCVATDEDMLLLEERLATTMAVAVEMEGQLAEHQETNAQLMSHITEKEREIVALQRQVRDARELFGMHIDAYFKERHDVLKLMEKIKRPLQQKVGCPQCDSWRTEVFVCQTHNLRLEEQLRVLCDSNEKAYGEMERLRQKNESTISLMADLRNQLNVVEDKELIVTEQKRRIEDMERQIEHHLAERVQLLMDKHKLEQQLAEMKKELEHSQAQEEGNHKKKGK